MGHYICSDLGDPAQRNCRSKILSDTGWVCIELRIDKLAIGITGRR